MAHPNEPLRYKLNNMHRYDLSSPYKDTYIINPHNVNLELDLLFTQLGFYYVFSRRTVKPGVNAILFCITQCLKPNGPHSVTIAGFTSSYDLLPLSSVGNTRSFLVVKKGTPASLRQLSMAQVLNILPPKLHNIQYLQSLIYPKPLIHELCSMPVNILNPRSNFLGQSTAYLEFASCWFCERKVEATGQLPGSCVQK
jgi:hypothetical protein